MKLYDYGVTRYLRPYWRWPVWRFPSDLEPENLIEQWRLLHITDEKSGDNGLPKFRGCRTYFPSPPNYSSMAKDTSIRNPVGRSRNVLLLVQYSHCCGATKRGINRRKGAATDRLHLPPPRHISTLPIRAIRCSTRAMARAPQPWCGAIDSSRPGSSCFCSKTQLCSFPNDWSRPQYELGSQQSPVISAVLGPLGGAGPFIGANIALSAVSAMYCWWQHRAGYFIALVVVVLNLITFGPHKYFSVTASLVYPAITVGTVLSLVLLVASIAGLRNRQE